MSSLPSQHPSLSLHLTDLSLTPLITSSSSQSHLESLTSLATTAITSQTTVQRANLGSPQRIMVEYPDHGPVVLHSYIDPTDSSAGGPFSPTCSPPPPPPSSSSSFSRPTTAAPAAAPAAAPITSSISGRGQNHRLSSFDVTKPEDAPPMLLSIVVAPNADRTREARKAAAKLEKVGRAFQREWASDSSNKPGDEPHA